jgi:hypothetical protein
VTSAPLFSHQGLDDRRNAQKACADIDPDFNSDSSAHGESPRITLAQSVRVAFNVPLQRFPSAVVRGGSGPTIFGRDPLTAVPVRSQLICGVSAVDGRAVFRAGRVCAHRPNV